MAGHTEAGNIAPGKYRFSLLSEEHRVATLTLWTSFFLCFSTLYVLMSWIPKLMEDSGFEASVGRDAYFPV